MIKGISRTKNYIFQRINDNYTVTDPMNVTSQVTLEFADKMFKKIGKIKGTLTFNKAYRCQCCGQLVPDQLIKVEKHINYVTCPYCGQQKLI